MNDSMGEQESVDTGIIPQDNGETPGYMRTSWTNGSYSIEWVDEDMVNIIDHSINRNRVIAGGDLEHLLGCVFI